jgi:Cytidylate kinase-like family
MPIITLSRGSLSGGELLANQLASKLGFKVISREVIVEPLAKIAMSESPLGILKKLKALEQGEGSSR